MSTSVAEGHHDHCYHGVPVVFSLWRRCFTQTGLRGARAESIWSLPALSSAPTRPLGSRRTAHASELIVDGTQVASLGARLTGGG